VDDGAGTEERVRRWRRARRIVWLPEQALALGLGLLTMDPSAVEAGTTLLGDGTDEVVLHDGQVRADLVPALTHGEGTRATLDLWGNPLRRLRRRWMRVLGALHRDGRGGLIWRPAPSWRDRGALEVGFPAASLDVVEVVELGRRTVALALHLRHGGCTVFVLGREDAARLLDRDVEALS
jgi:hypothetical protein